jgi:hypothetical protein
LTPERLHADACHRRKFPLCLYYSIADWHQPNYPNQGRHHELPPQPGDQPDLMKYIEFLKGQVRELCTNYGEIHGFWWDMNVDKHVDPSINNMIRKLQPKAVINNRGYDDGDFGTPERDYDRGGEDSLSFDHRTEACQSVGMESWGYRKNEDYYDDRHLLRSIDKYLARDANYLLNVGPTGEGVIPVTCSQRNFARLRPCSSLTVPANTNINELTTLTVTNTATDSDLPANALTFNTTGCLCHTACHSLVINVTYNNTSKLQRKNLRLKSRHHSFKKPFFNNPFPCGA